MKFKNIYRFSKCKIKLYLISKSLSKKVENFKLKMDDQFYTTLISFSYSVMFPLKVDAVAFFSMQCITKENYINVIYLVNIYFIQWKAKRKNQR